MNLVQECEIPTSNWTPTANNNEETLAIALAHELVAKFAKEFMESYNGIDF